jgi:hypothetical protein
VPPNGGQWNSGYQYTTYTGVAVANLIASISPQAQIIAGGNLDASKVGLFQNYWSAVAADGNIAAPVTLDQNSWQGQTAPEVQVTYSGYYHYTNYDQSIWDWTLPFGNAPFVGSNPGGYQAAPADIRYYGLPSYESTFVAGGTISGTGVSIDNTAGNAGIPSLGLLSEANQWMEGGTSRAELQAAGGALIGGLSGGSPLTALGGAAGAGFSSLLANQAKQLTGAITDATGSSLIGNISGNIMAGLGGALVGGSAGAAMASDVNLYNQGNDDGDKKATAKAAALLAQLNSDRVAALGAISQAPAGIWNSVVDLASMAVNIPNGGPLATPSDPGYVSLDGLRLPYAAGNQTGSNIELLATLLATKNADGFDLALFYKNGWADAQIAAANAKVNALNAADTVVTPVQRSGSSASSQYQAAGGTVPSGSDVDHTIDLQLGGPNEVSNMAPLDSSVNRSLGAQVQQQIKGLPPGTPVYNVTIQSR